jgi:hypothetical protein
MTYNIWENARVIMIKKTPVVLMERNPITSPDKMLTRTAARMPNKRLFEKCKKRIPKVYPPRPKKAA